MFNVDRWMYYSCQKLKVKGYKFNLIAMPEMTSRQMRRCRKKARKNNDYSIGMT